MKLLYKPFGLILGVIGLALDFSFRAVNRRLFRWADTTAAA